MWLSTGSIENSNEYLDAIKIKGKSEFKHRTGHEGQKGKIGIARTFFQSWCYMAVCGQCQGSAALPQERDPVPILPT
jgi:hypothetical protein